MTNREIVSGIFILPEGESKVVVSLLSTETTLKLCDCNNKARNSNVAVLHLVHIYFEQDMLIYTLHINLTVKNHS